MPNNASKHGDTVKPESESDDGTSLSITPTPLAVRPQTQWRMDVGRCGQMRVDGSCAPTLSEYLGLKNSRDTVVKEKQLSPLLQSTVQDPEDTTEEDAHEKDPVSSNRAVKRNTTVPQGKAKGSGSRLLVQMKNFDSECDKAHLNKKPLAKAKNDRTKKESIRNSEGPVKKPKGSPKASAKRQIDRPEDSGQQCVGEQKQSVVAPDSVANSSFPIVLISRWVPKAHGQKF